MNVTTPASNLEASNDHELARQAISQNLPLGGLYAEALQANTTSLDLLKLAGGPHLIENLQREGHASPGTSRRLPGFTTVGELAMFGAGQLVACWPWLLPVEDVADIMTHLAALGQQLDLTPSVDIIPARICLRSHRPLVQA